MKNAHIPKIATLVASFALAPQLVAAEISIPGTGLSLTGEISYEITSLESDTHKHLNSDVTLSWRPVAGDALTFGVDFAHVSSRSLWTNQMESTYWGGLVVGLGGTEMVIGAARPVSDEMTLLPLIGGNELVKAMSRMMLASATHVLTAGSPDKSALGVSLRSTGEGNLQWGVSVHKPAYGVNRPGEFIQDYDFTIVEAVAQYGFGDWTLGAQLVHTAYDGQDISYWGSEPDEYDLYEAAGDDLSAIVSARYVKNNWVLGGDLGRAEFWGTSTDFARLHGSYDFGNGFSLSGDVLAQRYRDNGETAQVYNINAEYAFSNGFYLRAAHFNTSETDDPYNSISAGYRF